MTQENCGTLRRPYDWGLREDPIAEDPKENSINEKPKESPVTVKAKDNAINEDPQELQDLQRLLRNKNFWIFSNGIW